MTDLRTPLSRRSLFSLTAGGASALAVGHALTSEAHAFAPALRPAFKPVAEAKLPKGLLTVPGDLKLDPAVRALAEKLLARVKHGFTTALTKPGEAPKSDRIVASSLKLVDKLRPARAARAESYAQKLGRSSSLKAKELGAFANLAPKVGLSNVFAAELTKVHEIERAKLKVKPRPEQPDWKAPLVKKIEFHLNSVKCIEETDENSESDEILLGGQLVEPNGNVKKIDRFKVSDDFDKGETRNYDYSQCGTTPREDLPDFVLSGNCPNGGPNDQYAGRKLVASSLDLEKVPWPSTLGLVLIMGEEDDSGGFGKILQDIYDAIKDEIDTELKALGVTAGAALGAAIGSVIPGLGTAIGAAIGAALAWLVGEFIEWFIGMLNNEDDLIQAKTWTIQLPSPELAAIQAMGGDRLASPAGTLASAMKRLDFTGDGGKYRARLHWRVST
ncbi:MAG: hypothetical protein H0T76_14860 [Nannocystis sp.]|nr:glycine zipper domain-containing protein [Nannocystis sp.]MBA3547762.1 hypothetical protein [Nannocystis sp.]